MLAYKTVHSTGVQIKMSTGVSHHQSTCELCILPTLPSMTTLFRSSLEVPLPEGRLSHPSMGRTVFAWFSSEARHVTSTQEAWGCMDWESLRKLHIPPQAPYALKMQWPRWPILFQVVPLNLPSGIPLKMHGGHWGQP